MQILLVLAHPQAESFAASVALRAAAELRRRGHTVDLLDLYAEDFDPRLTARERRSYATERIVIDCPELTQRLTAADALVLVFPQWWFNVPAILKGFFDRVLAPGIAFAVAPGGGRIEPRLTRLKHVVALTSTGSPWWVVRLVMGDPVRRLLKRGIVTGCAPQARFRMLTLHGMDVAGEETRRRHLLRIDRLIATLA